MLQALLFRLLFFFAVNWLFNPKNVVGMKLDREEDGSAMQDVLKEITGARTVPRVFINAKCIGGGDETVRAAADGTLQKLLAA
jgi:glutaredoxin 3